MFRLKEKMPTVFNWEDSANLKGHPSISPVIKDPQPDDVFPVCPECKHMTLHTFCVERNSVVCSNAHCKTRETQEADKVLPMNPKLFLLGKHLGSMQADDALAKLEVAIGKTTKAQEKLQNHKNTLVATAKKLADELNKQVATIVGNPSAFVDTMYSDLKSTIEDFEKELKALKLMKARFTVAKSIADVAKLTLSAPAQAPPALIAQDPLITSTDPVWVTLTTLRGASLLKRNEPLVETGTQTLALIQCILSQWPLIEAENNLFNDHSTKDLESLLALQSTEVIKMMVAKINSSLLQTIAPPVAAPVAAPVANPAV